MQKQRGTPPKKSGVKLGKPGTFTADDPRRGRGPKKGAPNAGRPTDEFKRLMQGFATSLDAQRGIEDALRAGAKHPAFLGALKHVTEHGYGKPTQDVTSGGKPLIPARISVTLVRPADDGVA